MIKLLNSIIDFITWIIDFIISLFDFLLMLIELIPQLFSEIFNLITTLPAPIIFVITFVLIVSFVYLIIGNYL